MPVFEEAFRRAIVRILVSLEHKHVCGAGFLIAPRLVLTCAHVVSTALNSREPARLKDHLVALDFPFPRASQTLHASILHIDLATEHDLAILELCDRAPGEIHPMPLKLLGSFWDHPYRVLGFSDRSGAGVWATGRLLAEDQTGMIHMASDSGSEKIIQEGFSGAPVWDEQEEAVVGMVSRVIAWTSPPSSRPLMMPLRRLCESWPPLDNYIARPPAAPVIVTQAPAEPFIEQEWQAGQLVTIAGGQYLLTERLREERRADPPALERWYLARPFPPKQRGGGHGVQRVLIKQIVLRLPVAEGRRLVQQLRDESELLKRLPAHAIFPALLVAESGSQSFTLVQRYPPGQPLSRCFPEQDQPADLFRARALLRALPPFCRQLAALHRLGVAHRYLCGESLIVELRQHARPVLRLRDLGLVTRPACPGEGPVGYAAPEQRSGRYRVPGSDLYQLGALLYHLLTGKRPSAFMYELPPPSSLQSQLPQALDPVLLRALEQEPERRWPDLEAFAAALDAVLQDWHLLAGRC